MRAFLIPTLLLAGCAAKPPMSADEAKLGTHVYDTCLTDAHVDSKGYISREDACAHTAAEVLR